MPKRTSGSQMIDLTNPGARVDIPDLDGTDMLTVSIPAAAWMGTAVVELKHNAGGAVAAYTPIKTITASSAVIVGAGVDGSHAVSAIVTTADSGAGSMRLEWFAEETQ